MVWSVLLASALAGPSVDLRVERPLLHQSAWQITSSDTKLEPTTAFWNLFVGTGVGFGGRKGTSWVIDLELGNRRVRWDRPKGVKEFGSTEVWGGGTLAWRRGLTGPRTDVAWPWMQAGLGWAFGNNGTRAVDYLYTPFQGPAAHAELGLELPGQKPTRPFIAFRWSSHLSIYSRNVNAVCGQTSTCYGLDGNSSAMRLGLQIGIRMGEPPGPYTPPEVQDGLGPVDEPAEPGAAGPVVEPSNTTNIVADVDVGASNEVDVDTSADDTDDPDDDGS
ncbi:MAG: hypothetical protein ACI8PZ_003566 [Myxococcota bacterium]|jgi:hypothetical protein